MRLPGLAIGLSLVIVGLQLAGSIDHASYLFLQQHFALAWPDLARLEVHRIMVSPLIQTSAGFSPTVTGLVIVAIPLAELRGGAIGLGLAFFGSDWLSTIPILLLLKLAGDFGNDSAAALAARPDSGSSSGGFGCLAFACVTLPLRWRVAGLGGFAVYFAVRLTGWHELSDFQHLAATLLGLGSGWLLTGNSVLPEPRKSRGAQRISSAPHL
jgi:hypothetical protein